MITLKQFLEEKRGLWDNIHAKRERIKHGSGEKMRKPGSKGAPTAQNFRDAAKEDVEMDEGMMDWAKEKLISDESFYYVRNFTYLFINCG